MKDLVLLQYRLAANGKRQMEDGYVYEQIE
jgi:hypothetical protein